MSATIECDLHTTVLGQWYQGLADNPSEKRNHFRTKLVYYTAAAGLVDADPARPLTWRRVVAAASPHGCRSTFYEVTGAHARHRMFDALLDADRSDLIQLALCYQRSEPAEQLIDETKLWSYWPFRQLLIKELTGSVLSPEEREEAMVRSLSAWARQHRRLAAALDFSPPACAAEDLMVIAQGRLAPLRAVARLSDLLRSATSD